MSFIPKMKSLIVNFCDSIDKLKRRVIFIMLILFILLIFDIKFRSANNEGQASFSDIEGDL